MKRIWLLVLALSIGLNAGLLYVALSSEIAGRKPGPDASRPPPPDTFEPIIENHLLRMTESLKLDEGQRSAIGAVHRILLPGIAAERRTMGNLRRAIAEHYEGPEIDSAEFLSLSRKLSAAQARLDSLVTDAMLGEAAVLTTEQRRKYAREMPWGKPAHPPHRRPGDEGEDR